MEQSSTTRDNIGTLKSRTRNTNKLELDGLQTESDRDTLNKDMNYYSSTKNYSSFQNEGNLNAKPLTEIKNSQY